MKSRWFDISVPIYTGMVHWPGDPEANVQRVQSMNDGAKCNLTALSLCAHTGTHMDAPLHFIKDGIPIEKVPLDAVIGICRVIEIKNKSVIPVDELHKHKLRAGERILFKTRNSGHSWKSETFDTEFVHIPKETAAYLVERGVRTIGVDYLSVGGYKKDGKDTHQILLGAEVWLIEGLNLSGIKPGKYDLVCLPLKILGSDGAPARAVIRAR